MTSRLTVEELAKIAKDRHEDEQGNRQEFIYMSDKIAISKPNEDEFYLWAYMATDNYSTAWVYIDTITQQSIYEIYIMLSS